MSREILFRGKTEKGDWVYGDLSCMAQRIYISQFTIDNTYKDGAENTHLYKHFWVIPETVGQYTGLTDKNGKKIFEGDIFYVDGENCVVVFENGAFCIKKESYNVYILDGEYGIVPSSHKVIGNIFDNAELLQESRYA